MVARGGQEQEKKRMLSRIGIGWQVACVLGFFACSNDSNILPKKERFAQSDGSSGNDDAADEGRRPGDPRDAGEDKGPRDPDANCVLPGMHGNERGVGGFCLKGGNECVTDGGPPRFCTGDFDEIAAVPPNRWFCTTLCTMDVECGSGASCAISAQATACVPLACLDDAGP